jgi:hypothetical protein
MSISKKVDQHKSYRPSLLINPSKERNRRSSTSVDRHRSDVNLYLIIISLQDMIIMSCINLTQYRTLRKRVR